MTERQIARVESGTRDGLLASSAGTMWHSLAAADVVAQLATSSDGLARTEAAARLDELPGLRAALDVGALANRAGLVHGVDGAWTARGDPTEAALLVVARKLGPDSDRGRESSLRRHSRESGNPCGPRDGPPLARG